MYRHSKDIDRAGLPLDLAQRAIVMLHGRGATSEDILSLAPYLRLDGFAILAPQASQYAWYPNRFIAPLASNEPALSSALELLADIQQEIELAGIPASKIYWLGFSQGACLALEYAARHAQRWGGVLAFSGGLIGEQIFRERYTGNFAGSPVYIGCSDVDPHIPLDRVQESAALLREMGANLVLDIFPGYPHTVVQEEIEKANAIISLLAN